MGNDRELRWLHAEQPDTSDRDIPEQYSPTIERTAWEDSHFTVLLANLDRDFCSRLSHALALHGCRATWADTAEKSLAQLIASSFDVLVVDAPMLGADSDMTLRSTRRLFPALAIIILTDCPSPESALVAVEVRADSYLCKPISVRQATDAIITACRAKRARERRHALLMALSGAAAELHAAPAAPQVAPDGALMQAGTLTLDRERRQLWCNEFPNTDHLELTEQETALMTCLIAHPGVALSTEHLVKQITGQNLDPWSATSIIRPLSFSPPS